MAPPAKTQPKGPRAVTTQLQHNKKQKQPRVPPTPVEDASPFISQKASQNPVYADFKSATGGSTSQGHKEVIIDMTDYGDITGVDWTAIGYQLTTLPGYFLGSVVRLLSVLVDVMPPAMDTNTAVNNVTVLAGVRMVNEGGGNNSVSLPAGEEHFIAPSNAPKWTRVLHANLSQLTKQGFQASASTAGVTEVARLALLNPDTGNYSTSTTLQTRIRLRYAVSLPLRTGVTVATSTVLNSDINAPFATPVIGATIFPKVVGMQNAI